LRCECVRAVASQDARQLPVRIGHDPHPDTRRPSRIKGVLIVIGHARHNQRSIWPKGDLQRCKQAQRPMLDRLDLRECAMDQQDTAWLHPKLEHVLGQLLETVS
jgi:hypothetical protein